MYYVRINDVTGREITVEVSFDLRLGLTRSGTPENTFGTQKGNIPCIYERY